MAAAAAAPSASLACDLDPKFFKGVLNGLTKKAVFADAAVTHALIADNLFTGSALDRSAIGAFLHAAERTIVTAAHGNWSLTELRAFLDKTGLGNELKDTWVEFWRSQRDKVNEHVIESSAWTDTVKRLAWRVDVVTSSKVQTSAQPLTEPTAVIELRTGGRLAPTASGVVVFEVNRAQLGGMLDEVARIEAVIAKHGGAAHDAEEGL